ncbi:MAG: hypothetical protein IH956_00395 [Chloroflexi bacterium]|nr:hypothetical protein [Chloroflexota bacterium]
MASERFQRRIDRLLDQIEEAADIRDWATVHQLAEDVLVADPGNSDAQNFLATAERALTSSASPATSAPITTPITAPDHPTSFANGRYQVKQFLGEGGKKKVYLTHDSVLLSGLERRVP